MSWPLVAIGDVAEILSGNAWKSSQFTNESEGRLPIIRIQNISDVATDFIYWDGVALEKYIIKDGDLLLSLSGNVKLCEWSFGNALLNQRIVKLAPTACVDKRYFYWALHRVVAEIEAMARHAVIANVSVTDLKEFQIPLPPLPEQKRIATILDKADAIRRKRQQAIQLADDFLRAVFLDMFGDPVTNPKGFPIGTIRDLVATADYGSSAKASETYGEYPILRMGNITYQGRIDLDDLKYINLEEKEKSKYLVEKGDLLFNRTNSKELVGKTAVYDMDDPVAIAGYLIRVRPNEMGDSHYISGYLNSAHGKATLRSICKSIVGMANINAQEMQNIPIMLPSIELQRKYQELVVATKCKLQAFDAALKLAEQAFNSLSYKAFSGQL
ncbi:TPA: restriction endonuclease subunit S [Pseudomonas aeruginosa]